MPHSIRILLSLFVLLTLTACGADLDELRAQAEANAENFSDSIPDQFRDDGLDNFVDDSSDDLNFSDTGGNDLPSDGNNEPISGDSPETIDIPEVDNTPFIDNGVPSVISIQVVDAETLEVLDSLSEGDTIDLNEFGGIINLTAISEDPSLTGSLGIEVVGCAALSRTENRFPYTLAPQQIGLDSLKNGDCSVVVTPFELADRGGNQGASFETSFTVIGGEDDQIFTGADETRVSVTLSWGMPLQRQNGDPLFEFELAGYEILFSSEQEDDSQQIITVSGANTLERTITGLPPGSYQFQIAALDTNDLNSGFSNPISVEIVE